MSQTPACERFQVFDAFVSPRVNSTGESLDNDILLLCVWWRKRPADGTFTGCNRSRDKRHFWETQGVRHIFRR